MTNYCSSRTHICINSTFFFLLRRLGYAYPGTRGAFPLGARDVFFRYILIKSSGTVFSTYALRSRRRPVPSFTSSSSVSLCFVENYKRWSYKRGTVVYTYTKNEKRISKPRSSRRSTDRSIDRYKCLLFAVYLGAPARCPRRKISRCCRSRKLNFRKASGEARHWRPKSLECRNTYILICTLKYSADIYLPRQMAVAGTYNINLRFEFRDSTHEKLMPRLTPERCCAESAILMKYRPENIS